MTPVARLASSLRYAWNDDKAAVLADWCEERELVGLARALRRGPSIRTRHAVGVLCRFLGLRSPDRDTDDKTFDDWAIGLENLHTKRRRGTAARNERFAERIKAATDDVL